MAAVSVTLQMHVYSARECINCRTVHATDFYVLSIDYEALNYANPHFLTLQFLPFQPAFAASANKARNDQMPHTPTHLTPYLHPLPAIPQPHFIRLLLSFPTIPTSTPTSSATIH